jgi:hypothetical protein
VLFSLDSLDVFPFYRFILFLDFSPHFFALLIILVEILRLVPRLRYAVFYYSVFYPCRILLLPVRATSISTGFPRWMIRWPVFQNRRTRSLPNPEIGVALRAGRGSKLRRRQIRRTFEQMEAAGLVRRHFAR